MNLKLRFNVPVAIVAAFYAFVSTPAHAASADECIHNWGVVIDAYNQSVEDSNRGWQNVTRAPRSAFNDFNSAASRADTYWYNFGGCTRETTLTDRDTDDWDHDRRVLVRESECGMLVASMEEYTISLDDHVDRYNRDTVRAQDVRLEAGVLEDLAEDVLYSYSCENDGWSLDLARNRLSWSRDVQNELQ